MPDIPKIYPAKNIEITGYEKIQLKSGIPCFGFNGAPYDIVSVDFVFDAGRWTETKPLVASFTSRLFTNGTNRKKADQIAEEIDFYGGTIRTSQGYNSFTITVYSILRNLEPVFLILKELFDDVSFPEERIRFQIEKKLSQLKINRKKTEFIADEIFKQKIFGSKHPYGYPTREKDISLLKREDALHYYQNNITKNNLKIILSGKYDNEVIALIDKHFTFNAFDRQQQKPEKIKFTPGKEKKISFKLPNAEQASLIIGKRVNGPNLDESYYDFAILNTILGGYFGSRLMKNIREDKGYTYGIHSELITYKHASLWCISTEVGLEYVEPCLEEIYKEIKRLKEEKVSSKELEKVRNYMLGKMLRLFDGPFNTKNTYMNLWNTNRDISHTVNFINSIKNVTSKRLIELANLNFDENSFYEVLVN